MALYYSLISVVQIFIIGLSFTEKFGVKFSYYGLILLMCRCIFRWFDIDETKKNWTHYEWISMVIFQSSGMFFILGLAPFMYANVKTNKFILPLVYIFATISIVFAINDENHFKIYCHHFVFHIFIFLFFLYFINNKMPEFYALLLEKRRQEKFKQIFDNLEETILIVDRKDNSI